MTDEGLSVEGNVAWPNCCFCVIRTTKCIWVFLRRKSWGDVKFGLKSKKRFPRI